MLTTVEAPAGSTTGRPATTEAVTSWGPKEYRAVMRPVPRRPRTVNACSRSPSFSARTVNRAIPPWSTTAVRR